jgi:3-deoxy-7-phosphoheptulonate synthase
MVIVMLATAAEEDIEAVLSFLRQVGAEFRVSRGVERTIIVVLTEMAPAAVSSVSTMAGVGRVVPISRPFTLASRDFKPDNTVVRIGAVELGTAAVSLIVGARFVEEDGQVSTLARAARQAGAGLVRVSIGSRAQFPYGAVPQPEALTRRAGLARETGVGVLAEVRSEEEAIAVASTAQALYVGGQDMGNAALLRCCASTGLPLVLERGPSAQIEEWLMAAEYVLALGHSQVVLCEAGIRTFEPAAGRTLDLSSLPLVRRLSHLPLMADPTVVGGSDLIESLALAAVGAGADAFVLEAAAEASAVGGQALSVEALSPLMKRLAPLCRALGRVPPSTASRQRVRPQRGPARGRGRGGRHRTE